MREFDCTHKVCHFDEGEISARSSTKISLLEWSYLRRFLLRQNDNNRLKMFFVEKKHFLAISKPHKIKDF